MKFPKAQSDCPVCNGEGKTPGPTGEIVCECVIRKAAQREREVGAIKYLAKRYDSTLDMEAEDNLMGEQ